MSSKYKVTPWNMTRAAVLAGDITLGHLLGGILQLKDSFLTNPSNTYSWSDGGTGRIAVTWREEQPGLYGVYSIQWEPVIGHEAKLHNVVGKHEEVVNGLVCRLSERYLCQAG